MSKVKIKRVNMKSGKKKIEVQSPYSEEFVNFARSMNGSWNGRYKSWFFDVRDEKLIREKCLELYGTDGEEKTETVTIRINVDDAEYGQSLTICGRDVAYRPSRDAHVRLNETIVIEGGFGDSGGSRKNPRLNPEDGTVLEARNVPINLAKKAVEENPAACKIVDENWQKKQLIQRKKELEAELEKINEELKSL